MQPYFDPTGKKISNKQKNGEKNEKWKMTEKKNENGKQPQF
jgi:hypothetical protein